MHGCELQLNIFNIYSIFNMRVSKNKKKSLNLNLKFVLFCFFLFSNLFHLLSSYSFRPRFFHLQTQGELQEHKKLEETDMNI